ncbi:alpha/beta hydrolase [Microbacterium sp. NPDC056234]|uniref:alpha/beta hydrolase n=1 Tax=Microbacterium sp. NPDC056234 TaxID=3345757 RepID=UPI0035D6A494
MQTPLGRLYIHGGGRRGASAWPSHADAGGEFVSFDERSSVPAQVELLARRPRDSLVFAHSIGAVPAVLAARVMRPKGLVLVEPALYDIARGRPTIERHVGIVTEARAQADAGNLRGFWAILRPLMFGGEFDAARWNDERPLAERWAETNLPWGHGVREDVLDGIPTLVVTGGWNDEYEVIAGLLEERGARHVVLPGAQHRPQDVAGFAALVAEFQTTLH